VPPDAPFDLSQWLESADPRPIVAAGDFVLRGRAAEVPPALLGTPALERLVETMVVAMRAAPGVGLAAPQIGVPLRVFVAEDTPEYIARLPADARALRGRSPLPLTVLINPRFTGEPAGEATFYEGCLSVPGYGALVSRATSVSISGVDASGEPLSLSLEGWPARIAQHEIDHLNGTLYVDRMVPRSLAKDSELPRLAFLPVAEVLSRLSS
jgi:peptide deformylase